MEKQETQRPNVLADVVEIYEYPKDTSTGVSKDISEKCLLGKWLIEEPYALIGHVRFCRGAAAVMSSVYSTEWNLDYKTAT